MVDHQYLKYKQHTTREHRRTPLQNGMRIIIESGLLFTTPAVINFVAYILNSNAFYITSTIVCFIVITIVIMNLLSMQMICMTGIAYNLIVIRAHNQSTDEYSIPTSIPLTLTNIVPDSTTYLSNKVYDGAGEQQISGLDTIRLDADILVAPLSDNITNTF